MTDYRDRISVALWVILLGLTTALVIHTPEFIIEQRILGSPVSIALSATTLLALLLIGLAAGGAEAVVQAHPWAQAGRLRYTAVYWTLPAALTAVALSLLQQAPTNLYMIGGLLVTGAALALAMSATYHSLDSGDERYAAARITLNLLTYGGALLLFLVVYGPRLRSLVSATVVLVVSALLALERIRGGSKRFGSSILYALVIGLVMGEATWALNYWNLSALRGGLLLMLLFYVMAELAHAGVQETLNRFLVIEMGLFAVVGLALIVRFVP